MKTIKTLAAALMLTLFAGSMANAQTPTNAPPAGGLTIDKLGEMIDLIGLEYEALKDDDGKVDCYKVIVERDGKRHVVLLDISPNKSTIWATTVLAELKSEHRADGSRLFKLFELHSRMKCRFLILSNGRFLAMNDGLANKNVTARELRAHIDMLIACKLMTQPDWETEKWGTPAPSPMPIPVPVEDMQ